MNFVYNNIECLITNSGVAAKGGVRPQEKDLGLISKASVVYSERAGILWTGKTKELPRRFKSKPWKQVNGAGLVAYPGLVDPHTHPVFSGDRSREFELRMRGASYQDIAAAGGGIVNSVANTRKASVKDLESTLRKRLDTAYSFGVRLLEAKSGYGLSTAAELKSLQAIENCQPHKIRVVPTCLAAHAIPKEKKANRQEYLDEIHQKILPQVAKKNLAQYVDVFCDEGYFSVEETTEIATTATKLGFSIRLHGEELAHTGIAELAPLIGAHSIDHLLKVSDRGISAMAAGGVVGILLPGTSFYLREKPAPARKMIDSGMVVALATDFNPGTCPTQNFPFIGSIAAISLGMTTAETIAAMTWNAARSLRQEKLFGCIAPGFLGKPAFVEGDHPSALFYRLAPAALPDPK